MDLGTKIRNIRIQKRRTLKEIAKRIGLTASFLSQVERDVASPSLKALRKIAEALDIGVGYFFEVSGVKEGNLIKGWEEEKSIDKDNLLIRCRCEKCGWINNYRFERVDKSLSEDTLGRKDG